MSKKIAIIGHGSSGLMAQRLAQLQNENPNVEIVTLDEAKQGGITDSYKLTRQFPIFDQKPITRAERRKNKRKK